MFRHFSQGNLQCVEIALETRVLPSSIVTQFKNSKPTREGKYERMIFQMKQDLDLRQNEIKTNYTIGSVIEAAFEFWRLFRKEVALESGRLMKWVGKLVRILENDRLYYFLLIGVGVAAEGTTVNHHAIHKLASRLENRKAWNQIKSQHFLYHPEKEELMENEENSWPADEFGD